LCIIFSLPEARFLCLIFITQGILWPTNLKLQCPHTVACFIPSHSVHTSLETDWLGLVN
jgi:hypothetical protein